MCMHVFIPSEFTCDQDAKNLRQQKVYLIAWEYFQLDGNDEGADMSRHSMLGAPELQLK